MTIGNYDILSTIVQTESSKLFLAKNQETGKRYVLKISNRILENSSRDFSIFNEFEIYKKLNQGSDLEIFKHDDQFILAREYIDGITLGDWMNEQARSLEEKIQIAVKIVEFLGEIHDKKLIHKDLNPSNVIVNEDSQSVYIIDFDLSSHLDFKSYFLGNPQKLEGTLPYISPEQTGRINRSVDYRSDLYSLGILLYELFTGILPFGKDDPLEIIHGHLSKKPVPLATCVPEIPPVIDAIIQKLLNKNAEDRYQSTHCLLVDLGTCASNLTNFNTIDFFEIGALDRPLYFQIPEKIYGRAPQTENLINAFNLCTKGRKLLVTLGGYAGIGKSTLVYDIHIPIALKSGFFIDGKYEQIQRNTPYLAWKQAFNKFVEIILTEDDDTLDYWKNRITNALGSSTGVITELIPMVEKIIGRQEIPEYLSAMEDMNRFNYALRQFVKAISTPEHPLVIFLDDLQWADAASLDLLRIVMTEPGLGHLLIITAFRSNEVSDTHPFSSCIRELEKEWKKVNDTDTSAAYAPDGELIIPLTLNNLDVSDILKLVNDTFKNHSAETIQLADLIIAKTKGNPFFIHTFLESLYEDNLIRLEQEENALIWKFDFDKIGQLFVSDSVSELMAHQLGKLPKSTKKALKNAACVGFRFHLRDLSLVSDLSMGTVESELWPAIASGYIIPVNSNYKYIRGANLNEDYSMEFKFAHDRIRQTIYDSISDKERIEIHHSSGRILLSQLNLADPSERIFDVAGHLNKACELVKDNELLRQINFLAGKKAKTNAAYESAYEYFIATISYSEKNAWENNYAAHLRLHIETAECAFLTSQDAETDRWVAIILNNAKSAIDYSKGIEIKVEYFFFQQMFQQSLDCGLDALKRMGMELPPNPTTINVIKELIVTKWKTRNVNPESVLNLKEIEDKNLIPILRMMTLLSSPVFFLNTNLFVIIVLRVTQITLLKGISSYGLFALTCYAYILYTNGEIEKGLKYYQICWTLLERKSLSEYKVRSTFNLLFFIGHSPNSVFDTLKPFKSTYQQSMESGDIKYTGFLGNAYTTNAFIVGWDLDELKSDLRRMLQYNIQTKNLTSQSFSEIYLQYVSCLQGDAADRSTLNGVYFNSAEKVSGFYNQNIETLIFNYHLFQSQLSLLFDNCEDAVTHGKNMLRYTKAQNGTAQGNIVFFLDCCFNYQLGLVKKEERKPIIRRLKGHLDKIRKIAAISTIDYAHKEILVKAFISALEENTNEAMRLFHSGIEMIDPNTNAYSQGVALSLYARYCLYLGLIDLAVITAKKSAVVFNSFGARGVADHINEKYAHLGPWQVEASNMDIRSSNAGSSNKEGIDIFSVIKGTQVISEELELSFLIRKLLLLMVENAGAERGVLVLEKENDFRMVAEADNQGNVKPLKDESYQNFEAASNAVMNYVIRTGNPVILDQAHVNGRFVMDGYIQKNEVRSLLCMKITHKSNLIGILYLENNLMTAAFTPNRIEILNILATQAAISIENAKYYKQINDLNVAYERFVPQSFLNQLERKSIIDIRLGDQSSKKMSVMFADIRGFTSLSERKSPDEIFTLLNEIWGIINPLIDNHGGIIDKYIGDAIMALFPTSPQQALKAAVEIQNRIRMFNTEKKLTGELIHMGMGINSGQMILGTVGSEGRLNTTVIGDTVNVAARLETLSKQLGAKILLTSSMMEEIEDPSSFNLRNLGRHILPGKSQSMSIIEEFSSIDEQLKKQISTHLPLFNSFIDILDQGDLPEAVNLLDKYMKKVPADHVTEFYKKHLKLDERTFNED